MAHAMLSSMANAHARLNKDLEALQRWMSECMQQDPVSWRLKTQQLISDLQTHFRLEEEGGYMESVRSIEPNQERHVHELAEEHKSLLAELKQIDKQLLQEKVDLESTRLAMLQWLKKLDHHQHRETRIIQEVFQQDCQAED